MLKFAIYTNMYQIQKTKNILDSHDTIEIMVKRYTAS